METLRIPNGTKNGTSGAITGYRNWFYGYYNGTQALADASAITGAALRQMNKQNGSFPTSLSTTKMQQMFFAAPAGKKTSLKITNAVNGAPLTIKKTTVSIEGANNYQAIDYDLYYVANAVEESGTSTWKIV